MTYFLPQSEVLGFASDDLSSSHSYNDAFFEESTSLKDDEYLDDPLDIPLSPFIDGCDFSSEPAYEIVKHKTIVPKRSDGLRLKLRMSNSVSTGRCGSVGSSSVDSSPCNIPDDSGVLNVEDFLNLPTDYVTMEESKQVAPSPSYSLSSMSTDPHSSYSPGPILTSVLEPPTNNCNPNYPTNNTNYNPNYPTNNTNYAPDYMINSSNGSTNTTTINCSPSTPELPLPQVIPSSSKTPPNAARTIVGSSKTPPVTKLDYRSGKSLPRQDIVPPSKKEKRRGSVSAISPPPKNPPAKICKVAPAEKPGLQISPNPNKNVMKRYYEKADILLKNREKEINEKKESKGKEGAVIGSMERGPRMFGVRFGPCDRPSLGEEVGLPDETRPVYDVTRPVSDVTRPVSDVTRPVYDVTRYRNNSNNSSVHGNQMVLNQQIKLNANSHSPKLPVGAHFIQHHNLNQPSSSKRSLVDGRQCPVPKAKIELPPYRPKSKVKHKDPVKCNDNQWTDTRGVIDMFYQKHLYCSIEKPLFESDAEVLKASQTYQLLLNTLLSLEGQRATALRDLDKLANLQTSALKRPYKFIKQVKKGEIVFPQRQQVVRIPEVKVTHRNKELDICHFKATSGQMVTKPSGEFSKTTRLKKDNC